MRLVANLKTGILEISGKSYPISNDIRTLRHGTRNSFEVVKSIPGSFPYDPQHFPKGLWRVTGVEWQTDERGKRFDVATYGPVKIKTDAWQMVNVWELDEEGDYLRCTDVQVKDTCYWLHYSDFKTTLGCIRLASPLDAVNIARQVLSVFGDGEEVLLEAV
jgi:hypothetical protein